MIIVQKSDFVGQYQLPRSIALDPILQSYIDREEKNTLYRLLGKELADLLIANIDPATHLPTAQRFLNIYNTFFLENDGCYYYDSRGLKDLLLIQIYSAYLAEEQVTVSQSGTVTGAVENGSVTSSINALRKGEQKWNQSGMETWNAIYWYCKDKYPDIYPEFKGVREKARYTSII